MSYSIGEAPTCDICGYLMQWDDYGWMCFNPECPPTTEPEESDER